MIGHTNSFWRRTLYGKDEDEITEYRHRYGRDMDEIAEVMKSDADAETKCKMISNILTAKPHYFKMQEPKESGDRE